jgi:hypothetical protein
MGESCWIRPPARAAFAYGRSVGTGHRRLPAPIRLVGKRALGASLRALRRPAGVHICLYHSVHDNQWDGFRRQLDWMQTVGGVVPYSTAVGLARDGVDDRAMFGLSFDDGSGTWPVVADELKSRDLSAMFFVVTERPSLPGAVLDWSALRTMVGQGMEAGSHTTRHVYLADQTDADAEAALRESKADVERELSTPCEHFAFPCGVPVRAFARRHVDMVRRAGYSSAGSTVVGRQRPGDDPFLVRRTRLEPEWPLSEVAFAVSRPGPASVFALPAATA